MIEISHMAHVLPDGNLIIDNIKCNNVQSITEFDNTAAFINTFGN